MSSLLFQKTVMTAAVVRSRVFTFTLKTQAVCSQSLPTASPSHVCLPVHSLLHRATVRTYLTEANE
jgi:hypothetical protein